MKTARELKKVKGILAKPAQKQGKVISQNTIDLVLSMYEDDEFSRWDNGIPQTEHHSPPLQQHARNTKMHSMMPLIN